MKIEIKKKPKKEFYDEFLYVTGNYKKIKDNPYKKVRLLTKETKKIYSFIMVFFALFILAYLRYGDKLYLFVIAALFLLSIFVIGYYSAIKKSIKLYLNNDIKQTINITDKGIELTGNSKTIKINWKSIAYIIINEYSICILPKKQTEIMIALSTDYKKEFLKGIKKYKKEDLVIDNKEEQ